MLTNTIRTPADVGRSHHRFFPRFQEANFAQNRALVQELALLAARKGCSLAQLALSCVRLPRQSAPLIVPVAGARSEDRVRENCADVQLSADELHEIDDVLERYPVAGARYPEQGMKLCEY